MTEPTVIEVTVSAEPSVVTVSIAGEQGPAGADGADGSNGSNGADGADGASAYQIALDNGFVGNEAAWLASLVGADGADGSNGTNGTNGTNGSNGADGADGASAYEIAVANGFVGNEAAWLASLQGADGADGADGVGFTDGDKGDITISGGGASLTIDASVISTFGRTLTDDADAATARTTLGLATVAATGAYSDLSGKPSLATVATTGAYSDLTGKPTLGTAAASATTDFAPAVGSSSIVTVGTIATGVWSGAAVAVAKGGTGATDASGARTNLGLVIGTDIQAYNSNLAAIAAGTFTGAASITTLGTVATGTWNATAIGPTKGGTGQTTYATGDLLYASASNTLSKLAAGTNTHVLTLAAGVPTWAAPSGGVSDGDKGDITVSGSGATWTIDGTFVGTALTAANSAEDDIIPIRDTSASAYKGQTVAQHRKLMRPQLTQLRRAAAQSFTTSVDAAVSWDTETLDEVNAWVVGSPTRITVPSGYTQMRVSCASLAFNVNATGFRYLYLKKNGTTALFVKWSKTDATDAFVQTINTWWLTVTATDYFELFASQASGGNLSTSTATGYETIIEVEWLA